MQRFAIEIDQLEKTYKNGFQALKGISLKVEEGDFFALLGPNGAGKSTLINTLAGLVLPTRGSVKVLGKGIVSDRVAASMNLGVVAQEIIYDPFLSVRETLLFQSGYYGLANNDDWIEELLHELGLQDKAQTPTRLLSGGMKRRVLVAQALVHKPPVIVLDEPTAGVDVELRHQLWKFIGRLHQKGHTVILTTHYLEEAQDLCSNVAILNHGEIVAQDKTDRLLENFQQSTVQFRLTNAELPKELASKVLRQQNHNYVLSFADTKDLDSILQTLLKANVTPENLTLSQASLEDVFVKLLSE